MSNATFTRVSQDEAIAILRARVVASGRKFYEDAAYNALAKLGALPDGTFWRESVEAIQI